MESFIEWIKKEIERIVRDNETYDDRVYWNGNEINGCDALRVLRVVLKKAQAATK